MPMPARDYWNKIQKEMHGQSESAQLAILRRHLDGWHDTWKGPYADLKKRLLKLASKLESIESVRSHAHGKSLRVKRQGVAQVPVIGVPNCGKSALVYSLTGASTTIADYPHATQDLVPGMLDCDGGALQLVDTPPIVEGLSEGEGAGRSLLAMVATTGAAAVVLDLSEDPLAQLDVIRRELAAGQIDLTPGPIATEVHPRGQGGIRFVGREVSKADQDFAAGALTEAGVRHAEVVIRESLDRDDLTAFVDRNKRLPAIILAHKADIEGAEQAVSALREAEPGFKVLQTDFFSESQGPAVAEALLRLLGIIRVDLLDRAAEDATRTPLRLPRASSVQDVAIAVPGPSAEPLKSARVWGPSVAQPGQTVGLHHLVADGDAVYLRV